VAVARGIVFARAAAFDRVHRAPVTRGTKKSGAAEWKINCQWGKNLSPNTWLLAINMENKTLASELNPAAECKKVLCGFGLLFLHNVQCAVA
jgi:hypothetical protein